MIGVIVNTLGVFFGSIVGLLCKKGIPQKFTDAIMFSLGLATIYIGIEGALNGQNMLVLIVSIALGVATGTFLNLDKQLNRLGDFISSKFKNTDGTVSVAEGFVTGSMLFCIGAMTIVGSLNAGLKGDNQMLLTKSILDTISSVMLSASLGIGILCSSAFIFVFEGIIVLLAKLIAPVFTDFIIAELTCAGSVIILGLGFNLMGLTKIKIANYLPTLVFVPIVAWLAGYLPL